jgi:hypothetical protein
MRCVEYLIFDGIGWDSIVSIATNCGPAQGFGIYHTPLPSAEVKESVELYLYSPCRL